MKIIFTDIAGTLNGNTRHKLNTRSMHVLNKVIEKTNAKLVIVSSWRLHMSLNELRNLFFEYGFSGDIIGTTEDLFPQSRGAEIQKWISNNTTVESFVILDDIDDYQGLKHKVVFTDASEGIDYKHYDAIINMLI